MSGSGVTAVSTAELRRWTAGLGAAAQALRPAATAGAAPADRLERLRALEELRSAVAAAQLAEAAALVAERRVAAEVEIATVPQPGVGARRRREHAARRAVSDIATARRISAWQANRFVRWAEAARSDTPSTFALLAAGVVSERRAGTVFEVASVLTPEQRREVDARLAGRLPHWGDRQVDRETRAAVYELDPAGSAERAAHARNERRVTLRPAPETMAWLTALLPLAEAVAARGALEQAAKAARGAGDPRTRGQVMADTLVERVTGQVVASQVPLSVQLLIHDDTLRGGDGAARFADGTPVPAQTAREWVCGETAAARSVRRLFTDPAGRLITAETASREFTPAMAEFVRLRDWTCTTAWCDAPIRHIDHSQPHVRGGPTSLANARGTCQWCNQTKADRPPDLLEPDPPQPDQPPEPHHPRTTDRPFPAAPCTPSPPRRRRRRRSRLERRAAWLIRAAPRGPGIEVDLGPHRCILQQ